MSVVVGYQSTPEGAAALSTARDTARSLGTRLVVVVSERADRVDAERARARDEDLARVAADLYGLDCVATDVADNPDAVTRFVLVRKPGALPEPTGADKTTLVAYMYADHSGALLEILEQFAMRGVNLTRIESRPTKKMFGEYCFSIDAEGHIGEPRLRGTLKGLHRICREVTFLGSYPRADQVRPKIARGFTADEYEAAEVWMDGLLGRTSHERSR